MREKSSDATNLVGEELWQALEDGADIEVMHVSDGDGDYLWKLNREAARVNDSETGTHGI